MKTYEKPVLMALSLGGNERLCGSCADKGASILLSRDTELANQLALQYGDGQIPLTSGEANNLFGLLEDQCKWGNKVPGYCRYTSGFGIVDVPTVAYS